MDTPNEDAQKALDAGGWRRDSNDPEGTYWRSNGGKTEKCEVNGKYGQRYGASSTAWSDTSKGDTI